MKKSYKILSTLLMSHFSLSDSDNFDNYNDSWNP